MMRLVTLLVCAALAACSAPRHWSRAETTEAEFNRDSYECAREVTRLQDQDMARDDGRREFDG